MNGGGQQFETTHRVVSICITTYENFGGHMPPVPTPMKEATLCYSNPQKHEEFYLAESLVLQQVVTYMSHVEAFASGIKIESRSKPFSWADQSDLNSSNQLKIKC